MRESRYFFMTNYQKLVIYTDGGARGNPGPAGIGVVIYNEAGKLIKTHSEYLGERTNNEAEYEAVIKALELAQKLGAERVEMFLDSELVARQLNSIYKIKEPRLQQLLIRVRNQETKFKKVTYQNVPREKNKLADQLVNEAIDKETKV